MTIRELLDALGYDHAAFIDDNLRAALTELLEHRKRNPHDAKLRRDAENVLTWKPPAEGDPLAFAHFQRFARELIQRMGEP